MGRKKLPGSDAEQKDGTRRSRKSRSEAQKRKRKLLRILRHAPRGWWELREKKFMKAHVEFMERPLSLPKSGPITVDEVPGLVESWDETEEETWQRILRRWGSWR
jgi:hypothetical protein